MVQNQIGTNQEALNQSNWKQLNGIGINLVVALEPFKKYFWNHEERYRNQSTKTLQPIKEQHWNKSRSSIGTIQ